jgi:hypothetical protein
MITLEITTCQSIGFIYFSILQIISPTSPDHYASPSIVYEKEGYLLKKAPSAAVSFYQWLFALMHDYNLLHETFSLTSYINNLFLIGIIQKHSIANLV